jgi:hypothetical protein
MTTTNGFAPQAPLYVRALRLRHLHMGGFVSFLLFECMIAAGVLLALAELVSWWAVPVLPAVVAIMVKVNDMAIGGSRRVRAQARAAALSSSERASSTRVDSDARIDEAPSVPRRTTTALDRAEIAHAQSERQAATRGSVAHPRTTRDTDPQSAAGGEAFARGAHADRQPVARGTDTEGRLAARGADTAGRGFATTGTDGRLADRGADTGRQAAVGADADLSASPGSTTGGRTTTRQAVTAEPPAQRKKVGVIRISVPPRDGGPGDASPPGW